MKQWMLALSVLPIVLQGCVANGEGGGLGCDSLASSGEEAKIAAFVDAAAEFDRQSTALEAEVLGGCESMAQALGVSAPTPMGDETQVQATCGAVSAEIEAIIDAALPAGATLTIGVEGGGCSIDVDAYASCVAECDVDVNVMNTLMCSPGAVRVGRCEATCSGECRVEGMAACDASCRGTCSGTCTGSCFGECDGTCSATDAMGNCVGTCDGTCMGRCDATCEGTCEGTCVAEVEGSCSGQCAGECSVEFEQPRCEGGVEVMADARCEAACEARLDAQVECTEPEIVITYDAVGVSDSERERFELLITVLRTELPNFLALQTRVERVVEAGATLASTIGAAAEAVGTVSVQATTCAATSLAATVEASTRVNVTFMASVEVTASANASASAN